MFLLEVRLWWMFTRRGGTSGANPCHGTAVRRWPVGPWKSGALANKAPASLNKEPVVRRCIMCCFPSRHIEILMWSFRR